MLTIFKLLLFTLLYILGLLLLKLLLLGIFVFPVLCKILFTWVFGLSVNSFSVGSVANISSIFPAINFPTPSKHVASTITVSFFVSLCFLVFSFLPPLSSSVQL